MKNILNEEKIDMSYENILIDVDNIKKMTFDKIKSSKPKMTIFKKSMLTAACFLLIVTLGGFTVYATGSPHIRGFINEILGLPAGDILYVGESISSDDYKVTILDVAYDGANGTMIYSVNPVSITAKETFHEYNGFEFFEHTGLGRGMKELYEYSEEFSKVYEYAFKNNVTSEYRLSELKISFKGIKDYILIPLESTTESHELEMFIPETDYSLATFSSINYSKLGFTLLGNIRNEIYEDGALAEEAISNIDIKFIMKDGETVTFFEEIYDYGDEEQYMNYLNNMNADSNEESEEDVEADGTVTSNSTVIITDDDKSEDGYNPFIPVISNTNDELFSGAGVSAFENEQGEIVLERTFSFKEAFDWTLVDKIIVNGTEIEMK